MAVQKKNRRKVVIKIAGFLTLILLLFVGWFFWAVSNDKPPQFFPLDNSQGKYIVTKNCAPQGWQDSPTGPKPTYCVIYRGSGIFMDDHNSNTFTVTVGKSNVDLQAFEDKEVKNIKGEFVNSSQQCIQDQCIGIKGSQVALNIESLEIANSSENFQPEVFVGRTPCGALLRNLHNIHESNCNRIKNRLMLSQNTFQYETIYVGNDDNRYILTGKWSTNNELKPGQTIYQLDFDNTDQSLSLLKVDNNVLLFLDQDMNILVGTAAESYVLNREK